MRAAAGARARHLQVDGSLLAPQAHGQLLEESVHDLLEPGRLMTSDSSSSLSASYGLATPANQIALYVSKVRNHMCYLFVGRIYVVSFTDRH